MVVQIYLAVDHVCDEGREFLDMLLVAEAELFLAQNIAQEIDGENLHHLDVSFIFGPQKLVSNFCHAVGPQQPIGDQDEGLRVHVLVVALVELRAVKEERLAPPPSGLKVRFDPHLLRPQRLALGWCSLLDQGRKAI